MKVYNVPGWEKWIDKEILSKISRFEGKLERWWLSDGSRLPVLRLENSFILLQAGRDRDILELSKQEFLGYISSRGGHLVEDFPEYPEDLVKGEE